MNTEISEREIEDCVDQLLVVLDKDMEYLEDNISRLNELRSLVVKQDCDALNQLLRNIQSETKTYHQNELKRQILRKKLAAVFNCSPEKITLTRLETSLTNSKSTEVTKRKTRLQELTRLLKKEYAGTQFLLVDCTRFNRLLLKSIFDAGQSENIMYKPTGTTERQTDTVFMNLQF